MKINSVKMKEVSKYGHLVLCSTDCNLLIPEEHKGSKTFTTLMLGKIY